MEGNLVFWLRNFHNAYLTKGARQPNENQLVKFELIASCLECRGTGTLMGGRNCRYCATVLGQSGLSCLKRLDDWTCSAASSLVRHSRHAPVSVIPHLFLSICVPRSSSL